MKSSNFFKDYCVHKSDSFGAGMGKVQLKARYLILALMLSTQAQAQSDCAALGKELQAMKRAQASLLQSFARKNDSMAGSLDLHADLLEKNEEISEATTALRQSAKAFRRHKEREQVLISRFTQASSTLIDQVEKCLDQNTVKKLGQR